MCLCKHVCKTVAQQQFTWISLVSSLMYLFAVCLCEHNRTNMFWFLPFLFLQTATSLLFKSQMSLQVENSESGDIVNKSYNLLSVTSLQDIYVWIYKDTCCWIAGVLESSALFRLCESKQMTEEPNQPLNQQHNEWEGRSDFILSATDWLECDRQAADCHMVSNADSGWFWKHWFRRRHQLDLIWALPNIIQVHEHLGTKLLSAFRSILTGRFHQAGRENNGCLASWFLKPYRYRAAQMKDNTCLTLV